MKKVLSVILAAGLMLSTLAGCGGSAKNGASAKDSTGSGKSAQASTEPIVLKLGHVNGDKTNYHYGFLKFAEEVERLTEGNVKVEVYANAQLGNERDMFEGMQLGTIDIGAVVTSVMTNFVPETVALDAPFMFKDFDHATRVIDGKVGDQINEKLKAQGFNNLGWYYTGFRNVFATRELPDLASFKGMKIRTMESDVHIDTFQALGAVAAPMPYGEVFTALQQKTVDAAENAVDNVLTQKFYEVTKNIAYTNHVFTFIGLGISNFALEKVPEQYHAALYEAGRNGALYQRQLLLESNEKAEAELKELGVKFYDVNREDFVKAVEPVYEKYSDRFDADILAEIRRLENAEN